jgi:hypothetical protein
MQLEPNANLPKRNVFSQREQDWFDCRVVEFKAIVVDGRTILELVRCNEWQEPPIVSVCGEIVTQFNDE